ncbi:hypothetical protein SLEP1_g14628 [Rubroshorea leprosula]|uniref:non-specific serine/threonine protein kinase n=1 Tax=Rubroshorea leprosula TaxID=152421 RepID=A0AAV5IU64_9ROSI|nr:hypothetical protein SLEP1_g14628 [Rubroshorea leprosula]
MKFPQFLLLFFLFHCILYLGITQIENFEAREEKEALLYFKSQLSDPQNALSGWTHNTSHCTWSGVLCSNNGSFGVQSLQLGGLGLTGPLSPQLANLTLLQNLNLSFNSFSGKIPLEFGGLSLLEHIDLTKNFISGNVPAILSACHNLTTLKLAGNNLTGNLPPELGNLQALKILDVSVNNLTSKIPSTFGNLSSLTVLALARNHLLGEIPAELGRLQNLQYIHLSENLLSGEIPGSFYNISSLIYLSLTQNNLTGNLPNEMGKAFQNLRQLFLAQNNFQGTIPVSITNSSTIEFLDLSRNRFHGIIPLFGNMKNLIRLDIGENNLISSTARNLQLIDSLANCTQLEYLMIYTNHLSGEFPSSVANLSANLQHFCFSDNLLTGDFPQGVEKFQNLISVSIERNSFTGEIPRTIAKLTKLQSFVAYQNMFSGNIPNVFGNFSQLYDLQIGINQFSGEIPPSLGYCQQLNTLDLAENRLTGSIPTEILRLSGLTYLFLGQNLLGGSVPSEVGNLKQLEYFNVSGNHLSGNLTSSIGDCSSLSFLILARNNLSGEIPNSVGKLTSMEILDLSCNNFFGKIPLDLENLQYLRELNLSFNHLEGEVPIGKIFSNLSSFSLQGNSELCSSNQEIARNLGVSPCKTKKTGRKNLLKILASVAGATLFITVMLCYLWSWICNKQKNKENKGNITSPLKGFPSMISYNDICHATSNFSAENLIGKGGFGSVYKAVYGNTTLAVKVLDLQPSRAFKSFLTECEALRNIRHRNVIKIITSCSSIDHKGDEFKALIMEFMPNGNLDRWLHPVPEDVESGLSLTLLQRLNIAIDIAFAVDYLHNDCNPPIIHCDLKPENVLLDEDMVAHVGDFGLARFISENLSPGTSSTIRVQGSIGYIAPEYGLGGKASRSGDVYSFGILLLEIFIAKKPTDGMFKKGSSLNEFASALTTDDLALNHIIDPKLFKKINDGSPIQSLNITSSTTTSSSCNRNRTSHSYTMGKCEECLRAVIRVGLACAAQNARDRLSIREVQAKLQEIKKSLHHS